MIPTGIDTEKFKKTKKMEKEIQELKKKYKMKQEDFIIGSVGRIAQEKSFDELIKFTQKLIKDNKNIKLIIVGDGPELNKLKELTKSLKIDKNVIFTGKVKYEVMGAYYHLFDVVTSFSTTETQGLTIIEALACSKPVLCINDESFRQMITNKYNGYLFKDGNDYIARIKEIIKNKKQYQELTKNALKSVEKYSKETFGKNVLKVYKETLKKDSSN